MSEFYGAEQAAIHHGAFGDLAADAAALLVERFGAAGLSVDASPTSVAVPEFSPPP